MIEGDDGNFLPTIEADKGFAKTYLKKFECIDPEDTYIYGEYNSDRASLMDIQLLKCNALDHPDVECKSEEDILEFFRGKFVLLKFNQVRFDSNFYGEQAIVRESRLLWIQINT